MGERAAALQRVQRSEVPDGVKVGPGGSREVSFVSRSWAKSMEDSDSEEGPQQKRRGVQPLRLRPDNHRLGGVRGRRGGGRQGRGRGGRGRR